MFLWDKSKKIIRGKKANKKDTIIKFQNEVPAEIIYS